MRVVREYWLELLAAYCVVCAWISGSSGHRLEAAILAGLGIALLAMSRIMDGSRSPRESQNNWRSDDVRGS